MCKFFFAIFIAVLLVSCHISEEKKLETAGEKQETADEKINVPYSIARKTWVCKVIKRDVQEQMTAYYVASIALRDSGKLNYACFTLDIYKKGVDYDTLRMFDGFCSGPGAPDVYIQGRRRIAYLDDYSCSQGSGRNTFESLSSPVDSVLNEFKQYLSSHIDDNLPGMFYNLPIKPDTVNYYQK